MLTLVFSYRFSFSNCGNSSELEQFPHSKNAAGGTGFPAEATEDTSTLVTNRLSGGPKQL